MNLPNFSFRQASSRTFMVFSMLLLGALATWMLFAFDSWMEPPRPITTKVMGKIAGQFNVYVLILTTGIFLVSFGFFFYLLSFFLFTAPTGFFRSAMPFMRLGKKKNPFHEAAVNHVLGEAEGLLSVDPDRLQFLPDKTKRNLGEIFLFLNVSDDNREHSSNVRFVFTQLMFARSVGGIVVTISLYIAIQFAIPLDGTLSIVTVLIYLLPVLAVWAATVVAFAMGCNFFDDMLSSAYIYSLRARGNSSASTFNEKKPEFDEAPLTQQADAAPAHGELISQ